MAKRFRAEVIEDDDTTACGIQVPFDPKEAFGKVRAPVAVTINGYTFRTTVFRMQGVTWFPLNKQNRTGAGVSAGDQVTVHMALDTEPRVIEPPADLSQALRASKRAAALGGTPSLSGGSSATSRRTAARSSALSVPS